jgi:hypothetical protein
MIGQALENKSLKKSYIDLGSHLLEFTCVHSIETFHEAPCYFGNNSIQRRQQTFASASYTAGRADESTQYRTF